MTAPCMALLRRCDCPVCRHGRSRTALGCLFLLVLSLLGWGVVGGVALLVGGGW